MVKYNKLTHEALSVAISKEAMKELRWLSSKLGLSQKSVVEIAIRELADREWERRKRKDTE